MKPFLLVLLLIVSGLYLIWTGVSGMIFSQTAKSWPTVQGTVHVKNVWTRHGRHGFKDYIPVVRYYYELNGAAYTSEKITHESMSASTKADAMKMLSPYFVGMPTTVHYNPQNPSDAVLQIDHPSRGLLKVGLGMLVLLLGLLLGYPWWKDFNSNRFYDPSESAL